MPNVSDVCRYVRSKNAGPFWVTVDVFFRDAEAFAVYSNDPALSVDAVAPLFGVDPGAMKRFSLPDLSVLKFSFPRAAPQGGRIERDMHGGQQFVPLLNVALSTPSQSEAA